MVNAWSLLYDEINGTMDETYPIKKKNMKNNDVTVLGGDGNRITPQESDEYDPITTSNSSENITFNVPEGVVGAADTINIDFGGGPDTINFGSSRLPGAMGEDHISISGSYGTAFDDPKYYATPYTSPFRDDSYPTVGGGNTASESDGLNLNLDPDLTVGVPETLNLNIDTKSLSEWERIEKPQPNLKDGSNQKYQEDKGIADLKSYVASTYKGHYTNENSDVQTLDLIHSVGDAESFCRSNALKYLSRYDKKGSAKNDILKAMHYCLLLYYFSGNTQEPDYTNSRYETF